MLDESKKSGVKAFIFTSNASVIQDSVRKRGRDLQSPALAALGNHTLSEGVLVSVASLP